MARYLVLAAVTIACVAGLLVGGRSEPLTTDLFWGTWEEPFQNQVIRATSFVDGEAGWAVGIDGTILATRDGGRAGKRSKAVPAFSSMAFISSMRKPAGPSAAKGPFLPLAMAGQVGKRSKAALTITSVASISLIRRPVGPSAAKGPFLPPTMAGRAGKRSKAVPAFSSLRLTSIAFISSMRRLDGPSALEGQSLPPEMVG